MIYHVSICGDDRNAGTASAPFRTLNHAASVAVAGDTVLVHEGTYREWVKPQNSGTEDARITYEAAEGEHVVIKGSELVTDWERVEGTVWKKTLPNEMFGDWNPYAETVWGDWMKYPDPEEYFVHLGDVYLNGVSMYEARSLDEVKKAEKRLSGFYLYRTYKPEYILRPEETVYQWYAEVDEDSTTLWCNFQEYDPNAETVEINVRKCCFYPTKNYLNYITVRGFEIAHAACPFTPPTADQIGMVGPNWAKGWIIENNDLHDAKCSAVSIGKEASTGHNLYTLYDKKPGYQYQMEAVFLALKKGWSKETIGSHIIRNNKIHDCGQNGIVGHLGCAFSRIEHNHIYNISKKQEFWGHEIGGIKLHAALDVIIENNHIHDCSLGTWLDWQVQGTRITKNLYHSNDRDLMIEVTHGPCLIDHNVFMSEYALDNVAQGTAYVHNLVCGYVRAIKCLDRATPYHFPHSTQVAGCAVVYGGDDRVMNNLVLGTTECPIDPKQRTVRYFGSLWDEYSLPEEYPVLLKAEGNTDHAKYFKVPQPVWIEGNAYSGYATPFRAEKDPILADGMCAEISGKQGEWILTVTVPDAVASAACTPVTTERLGAPRITEEGYENPDGTPVDLTLDLLGKRREGNVIPGPFATLRTGKQSFVIWKE